MTNQDKTAEQLRASSLEAVVAFLLGEGELDGCNFGEKQPWHKGNFWWRNHLRDAWNTLADSGEAVAWLHTMHMELGQTARLLNESATNPWGTRGKHYDDSYTVTSVPLFTNQGETSVDVLDAVHLNLLAAAQSYYTRYCVDEADEEGPHWTGCSEQQSIDARELRDAISAAIAIREGK